jgi:hypothetical protein
MIFEQHLMFVAALSAITGIAFIVIGQIDNDK